MSQDFRWKYSRRNQDKYMKIIEADKMKNSVTYKIELEDHTLGDLIRIFLLKNQEVKFAGYRLPHPLEDILEIKVQTNEKHPNHAMKATLSQLQKDLVQLESEFDEALLKKNSESA